MPLYRAETPREAALIWLSRFDAAAIGAALKAGGVSA